jgi:hypothetical protein
LLFLLATVFLNRPADSDLPSWRRQRPIKNELNLARRLNKRLLGILIEEWLVVGDLPADVTSKW